MISREHMVDNAKFLIAKRSQYVDLSERVKIATSWKIIEEIHREDYTHFNEDIECSLMLDVLRISSKAL